MLLADDTKFIIKQGHPTSISENICSEDDLRSTIFGTVVVKFLACPPVLVFSNIEKNGIIAYFKRTFTLKWTPRIFGISFLAEIFDKVSFDPYNFRITRLSARKSEQMKNFEGIKNMPISTF